VAATTLSRTFRTHRSEGLVAAGDQAGALISAEASSREGQLRDLAF